MAFQIAFLNPYGPGERTGGIKTLYRHAELLRAEGLEVGVIAQHAGPTWFETTVPSGPTVALDRRSVLVLDEIIRPENDRFLALPCRKEMFCQAWLNSVSDRLFATSHRELGYDAVYGNGVAVRDFFARVYGLPDLDIVPPLVDPAVFQPRPKRRQIAVMPGKLREHAVVISHIFRHRHARFRSVPWVVLEGRSEAETAAVLGESEVFLFLPKLESLGLPGLEAMACEALVVGFTGVGAAEYASRANGFWFDGDDLFGCADALAQALTLLETGDPQALAMREAGRASAAAYGPGPVRAALRRHFDPVLA